MLADDTQLHARLARLVERMGRLRAADPDCKRFGSGTHRYRFGPTLSESLLWNFEQEAGVALPADFRAFLTQVGNGGAGPSYGWRPFDPTGVLYRQPEWRRPWSNPNGLPEEEWEAVFEVGTIELSDQGCGMFDFLVVTGSEAGTIWFSDEVSRVTPVVPRSVAATLGERAKTGDHDVRIGFLDYVEAWTDECLATPLSK